MLYKITNKQERTYEKDGETKKYVSATLTDENGEIFEKVGAFRGEFAGDTYDGELVKKGNFWNLVTKKAVAGANFKAAQMEKVMEKKDASISRFQSNKEESIKVSSTFGNAVQCALAVYGKDPTRLNTLEEEIIYWRKWLWSNYEVDPKDFDPITNQPL